MSKKPETVWFAFFNIGGGLHNTGPMLGKKEANLLHGWWHKDYSCHKLGLDLQDTGYGTFAAVNKTEVKAFIAGYKACAHLIAPLVTV